MKPGIHFPQIFGVFLQGNRFIWAHIGEAEQFTALIEEPTELTAKIALSGSLVEKALYSADFKKVLDTATTSDVLKFCLDITDVLAFDIAPKTS
jgi:hypothetical protein